MKKLLQCGTSYARQSDWRDFALVKFCLCAMGILIGCSVPKKHKKWVMGGSIVVFVATYIPLMVKFFRIIRHERAEEQEYEDFQAPEVGHPSSSVEQSDFADE